MHLQRWGGLHRIVAGHADEITDRTNVWVQGLRGATPGPAQHYLSSSPARNGAQGGNLGLQRGACRVRIRLSVGRGRRRWRDRSFLSLHLPNLPLQSDHPVLEIADLLHENGIVRIRRCGLRSVTLHGITRQRD